MTFPKVSIVVLNWNGKDDTLACLKSLGKLTYPNREIVVVDNGSSGDDVEAIRHQCGGTVTLIETRANLGYAGGNNVGLKRAFANGAEFGLVLNNDTTVEPGFLEPLVDAMTSDSTIGIAGPKTFFLNDPTRVYFAGGFVNWWRGDYGHGNIGRREIAPLTQVIDTAFVAGSAMMISSALFRRLGPIPEEYFLLFEDIEYSLAAQAAGFRTVCVGNSVIYHKYSGTINQGAQKISYTRIYYSNRNRVIFFRRHARPIQRFTAALWFTAYEGPKRLLYWTFSNRDVRTIRTFFAGLRDGLAGMTGRADLPR